MSKPPPTNHHTLSCLVLCFCSPPPHPPPSLKCTQWECVLDGSCWLNLIGDFPNLSGGRATLALSLRFTNWAREEHQKRSQRLMNYLLFLDPVFVEGWGGVRTHPVLLTPGCPPLTQTLFFLIPPQASPLWILMFQGGRRWARLKNIKSWVYLADVCPYPSIFQFNSIN